MTNKDILIHYIVTKKEDGEKVKIKTFIQSVYTYVQNHEIYFKYEPSFYKGVLVFGIIGFKKDHNKLKKELGELIDKLGCQLIHIDGTNNPMSIDTNPKSKLVNSK